MKKIEVCVPVECVEALRAELATAGILTPAGMTSPCGLFRVGETTTLEPKLRRARKATHQKVELIVSDRLAPRAVELITDWLALNKTSVYLSHLIVLDVEGSYQFEPPAEPPLSPNPPSSGRRTQ